MEKIFKNAEFEEHKINNLEVLFLLSLMLIPYLKWIILFFGVVIVCKDLFSYWKRRKAGVRKR